MLYAIGFGPLGLTELLVILGIVVLLFGSSQLPKLGRNIGQTIKEIRGIGKDLQSARDDVEREVTDVKQALK